MKLYNENDIRKTNLINFKFIHHWKRLKMDAKYLRKKKEPATTNEKKKKILLHLLEAERKNERKSKTKKFSLIGNCSPFN